MTEPNTINELWAWISDEEGGEGVIAVQALMDGELTWMPLIGADKARLDSLRPQALSVAKRDKRAVKLIHLSVRTDIETIDPEQIE
jgi:hypothetical protein